MKFKQEDKPLNAATGSKTYGMSWTGMITEFFDSGMDHASIDFSDATNPLSDADVATIAERLRSAVIQKGYAEKMKVAKRGRKIHFVRAEE